MEGSKDDSCELNKQSYPNFYLANLFYILQLSHISVNERNETLQKLMEEIKKNNMHPYYNYVCEELNINRDQDLYNSLKEKADEELNEIEKKILEATENFDSIDTKNDLQQDPQARGTSERKRSLWRGCMEAFVSPAPCTFVGPAPCTFVGPAPCTFVGPAPCTFVGPAPCTFVGPAPCTFVGPAPCAFENAYKEYEEIYKKGIGIGAKLDILLTIIRISIFFNDMKNTKKYLEQATMQMEKGGDWERKNKLKIYEALNYIMIRNFPEASKILIDAASTFTATEIISYDEIIFYMTEERTVLNKKILNSSVILQVTSSDEDLHSYISSFYHCDYRMFMEKTIKIALRVKRDRYLGRHYRYFIRNTRVRAYRQFLEPFKSVTLKNMAYAFGVSEEFIEEEVSSFIANGKLNCKIDKVNGSIESNQPNERNTMYLNTIKKVSSKSASS
ncbi:26S proteasome regulatory complex subunit [Plasmodium ovale wallikeri]|uniref:26S proteasome regulatory complex subunit n=1 Tax=Plasmodium ovale wallikeri TaxID=864142 RepID=A0A1A8YV46_PLAOA|nr:26S proteasome regulatory complex subunit [Plasmodium ovale wallikeri]SBT35923.1 26S proteasome regulatory complex subunit [Plasmodium ovale wallikeri]